MFASTKPTSLWFLLLNQVWNLESRLFVEEKGMVVKLECASAAQVRKDFEFLTPSRGRPTVQQQ